MLTSQLVKLLKVLSGENGKFLRDDTTQKPPLFNLQLNTIEIYSIYWPLRGRMQCKVSSVYMDFERT